jgi:hypothetical protein
MRVNFKLNSDEVKNMKNPHSTLASWLPWLVVVALVFVVGATLLYPTLRTCVVHAAQDKDAARPSGSDQSTTLSDQTELSVSVYNSNIALVRDVRQLTLPPGAFLLKFEDIAATVNPATVHFRSLTDPDKLGVLEQNYEYDLLDPTKMLHKYVGKEITVAGQYYEKDTIKQGQFKATLLSDNNGTVWKVGNDIVTNLMVSSYLFPEVPANLYDHPTLLMSVENSGPRKQQVEASYLATSLSWNTDYVLTVARDDKAADLDGWVTLTNNSGTAFHNAHLQLIAGDLNRLPVRGRNVTQMVQMEAAAAAVPAPQFQQENFSEYHLYTLGRRTSVENQETKQISLLQGTAVPVEKIFVVNGQNYYYRNAQNPGSPIKDSVMVYYKFKNEEKAGLGMPLPAGSLRVYQKDSKGGILFVGEDHIDHIPKDEDISVHIGNAFDVVAERKQTDFQKIDTRTWEMEFEITLRNHKDTPVTVQVNEPIGGDWEMLSSTYKFTKMAAFAAQFNVPVDKNGTSVLKYRIRAHW